MTPASLLAEFERDASPVLPDEQRWDQHFMQPIVSHLYISSSRAINTEDLQANKIRWVLNLQSIPYLSGWGTDITNYEAIEDGTDPEYVDRIAAIFDDTYHRIDAARERGENVLVNCYAGISRSATIVIAYLMRRYQLAYWKALQHCVARRPFVNPNDGFKKRLIEFQHEIRQHIQLAERVYYS